MSNCIYEVRDVDGKLIAQCLSYEACVREAAWHDISEWSVATMQREPSWGYGLGASNRYVRPWPDAKIEEFRLRYARGDALRDLEAFFEASNASLLRLARRLGFPHRITWEERQERHGGLWTDREQRLVIGLYREEGMTVPAITGKVDRTAASIRSRLTRAGVYVPLQPWQAWTERERQLVLDLYRSGGVTEHDVATRIGRPLRRVRRHLAQAGLIMLRASNRVLWTPQEDEDIARLFEVEKAKVRIVAEYVERTPAQVRKRLAALGLWVRQSYGAWTGQQDELINFMYDEGIGINEIAEHIERLPSAVLGRLRKTGKALSTRTRGSRVSLERT